MTPHDNSLLLFNKDRWFSFDKSRFWNMFGFNATLNNISVILWRSVLLVEETRVPIENHRPVASHWQTLSHNVLHLALIRIRTHNISGDRHEGPSRFWIKHSKTNQTYINNTPNFVAVQRQDRNFYWHMSWVFCA